MVDVYGAAKVSNIVVFWPQVPEYEIFSSTNSYNLGASLLGTLFGLDISKCLLGWVFIPSRSWMLFYCIVGVAKSSDVQPYL